MLKLQNIMTAMQCEYHLARWLTELLCVPCCCRKSRSKSPGAPWLNTSVAGRNSSSPNWSEPCRWRNVDLRQISTEYIAPTCVSEKGAMSGPAHESMALVIVLPGSPVSHMLAKVGEQLRKIV